MKGIAGEKNVKAGKVQEFDFLYNYLVKYELHQVFI
jgi:hypothetical protein